MVNFKLERFKKLPKRAGEIWQGGVFRLPAWYQGEDGQPVRPEVILWLSLTEVRISKPRFPEPDEDRLAVALESVLEYPFEAMEQAFRPTKIEVEDDKLAEWLGDALKEAGVRVERVGKLEIMRKALAELAKGLSGKPEPPDLFSERGITIKHVRSFAEGAERFFKARPWEELQDTDLIQIEHPSAPAGFQFVSVMGNGGQTFGLGFFESLKQFEKMKSASTPGRYFARNGTWSVLFGEIAELPLADADLWEEHALPVAGANAYPHAMWFGPKKEMRRPDARQLTFIDGLLRALAASTAEQLDAGQWSEMVETIAGEVKYSLSLVNDASTPQNLGLNARMLNPMHLRWSMEESMAQLDRLTEGMNFSSIEAFNQFARENMNSGQHKQAAPRTPLEAAQQIMYEAWGSVGRRRRVLARKALEICADCADAYALLAEETGDAQRANDLYRQGMEAGKRALGSEVFEKERGRFWGILTTRPYMRACTGFADTLWVLGRRDEAVAQYQEMLGLNPNDNQGVRYFLAAYLLELGRNDELEALLDRHEEDSAQWKYMRALCVYRRGGDSAEAQKALKSAVKCNPHVPGFLTGVKRMPSRIPDSYIPGDKDEAAGCIAEIGNSWTSTPGAIDWLKRSQMKVGK